MKKWSQRAEVALVEQVNWDEEEPGATKGSRKHMQSTEYWIQGIVNGPHNPTEMFIPQMRKQGSESSQFSAIFLA